MHPSRRHFLHRVLYFGGILSTVMLTRVLPTYSTETRARVTKTESEWHTLLNQEQFAILREEATEHPFTSALLNEHRKGQFVCVGCQNPLFNSDTKFDSGTGWPSFFDVIAGAIETKKDHALLMERVEYHCATCGGHHGHIFDDGPKPTGLRYCNNGAVLRFIPA